MNVSIVNDKYFNKLLNKLFSIFLFKYFISVGFLKCSIPDIWLLKLHLYLGFCFISFGKKAFGSFVYNFYLK